MPTFATSKQNYNLMETHEKELIIRIKTATPDQSRFNLIRAIAASMRWAAHADKTDLDSDNIVYLAQFMEEIIPHEKRDQ